MLHPHHLPRLTDQELAAQAAGAFRRYDHRRAYTAWLRERHFRISVDGAIALRRATPTPAAFRAMRAAEEAVRAAQEAWCACLREFARRA